MSLAIPSKNIELPSDLEADFDSIGVGSINMDTFDSSNSTRNSASGAQTPITSQAFSNALIENGILLPDGTINATTEGASKLPATAEMPKQYEKKSEEFWRKRKLVKVAYWYHLICFAGAMILSASCFNWNIEGIALTGFPNFLMALILVSTAFQLLALCLAELCSALPFSGGSYGFARATIGIKSGMFVGLIESLEYILTTAVNVVQTTTIVSIIFQTDSRYNIVWDICLLALALSIQIYGGEFYWNMIIISGALTFICLFIYFFSTVQYIGDLGSNPDILWTVQSGASFMTAFPNAVWYYVGIEAIPLTNEEVHDCKQESPFASIYGMASIIAITFLVFITACATPNSDILASAFPLTEGYSIAWGLEYNLTAKRGLLVLAFIPMYSATFSFIFCFGRQIFSMSRSGLIPAEFSLTTEFSSTPYVSMTFGTTIVMCLCFIIRLGGDTSLFVQVLYKTMLLTSITNYLFQLVAYIIMKAQYSMLMRSYTSPAGITGAVVAFIIYFLALIGIFGWNQGDSLNYALVFITCWVAIGMSYYYFVSSKNLLMSPEEQFSMFMLYSRSKKFINPKLKKINRANSTTVLNDAKISSTSAPTPNVLPSFAAHVQV